MEDDDIRVSGEDDEEAPATRSGSSGAAIDPTDGDAELRKPTRFWVWLAPDWSEYGDSQKDKTWTRVQVEESAYQDGRVVVRVLDANQRPIMHQTLEERVDTKQQDRFKKSVADAAKNKPRAPTIVTRGPDGKNHIMERDADGNYTIDRGLAASQPTPEKKPTSPAANWQPLKGPDGKVVALLDPATGDTVAVSQKDPKDPQVFQTKDGRVITVSPDGATAKDVTPEGPGDKVVPKGFEFRPDLSSDDGGLTAYNEKLLQARRDGTINRQQGLALLEQAAALLENARAGQKTQFDQGRSVYDAELNQRNQDLDEVRSRRDAADRSYGRALEDYSSYTGKLSAGDHNLAAEAFRDALEIGRENAEKWGGMRDVDPVELPPAMRKMKISRDGTVSIEIPDPTPNTPLTPEDKKAQEAAAAGGGGNAIGVGAVGNQPAPGGQTAPAEADPAAPSGPPARDDWRTNPGDSSVPFNPPSGEAGNDPTRPVGQMSPAFEAARTAPPQWSPDPATIAGLKADGYSDEEIAEALGRVAA